MITGPLDHAQKHLNECRELLKVIPAEGRPLVARLKDIASLKMHLEIIKSDADRALLTIGA